MMMSTRRPDWGVGARTATQAVLGLIVGPFLWCAVHFGLPIGPASPVAWLATPIAAALAGFVLTLIYAPQFRVFAGATVVGLISFVVWYASWANIEFHGWQ